MVAGVPPPRHHPPRRSLHPRNWEGYELVFRYHSARYTVVVTNPHGATRGVASVELNGERIPPVEREGLPPAATVELVDDGREHEIRVGLGVGWGGEV